MLTQSGPVPRILFICQIAVALEAQLALVLLICLGLLISIQFIVRFRVFWHGPLHERYRLIMSKHSGDTGLEEQWRDLCPLPVQDPSNFHRSRIHEDVVVVKIWMPESTRMDVNIRNGWRHEVLRDVHVLGQKGKGFLRQFRLIH